MLLMVNAGEAFDTSWSKFLHRTKYRPSTCGTANPVKKKIVVSKQSGRIVVINNNKYSIRSLASCLISSTCDIPS